MTKALTNETDIIHGKEPTDLPEYKLLCYETGTTSITAACTGPDEGLTGVKRSRTHLSAGPDIDFIDTNQDQEIECRKSASSTKPPKIYSKFRPDQNANKPFTRSRKQSTGSSSSSSKGSTSGTLSALESKVDSSTHKQEPKIEKATINVVVSLISSATTSEAKPIGQLETNQKVTITKTTLHHTDTLNKNTEAPKEGPSLTITGGIQPTQYALYPSSSAIDNAQHDSTAFLLQNDLNIIEHAMELPATIAGVSNWKLENDHAYGLSVSLYEKNFITNEQAGNPVADCYGLVVRGNAAAMALADGVNWGNFKKELFFF